MNRKFFKYDIVGLRLLLSVFVIVFFVFMDDLHAGEKETAARISYFKPGLVWTDTNGKVINAHGGGFLYYNGTYYWFG